MSSDVGAKNDKREKTDVVFVHSPAESGDGFRVIRAKDNDLQFGEIRSVKEGEPISGDLVRLSPRKEHNRLFDVEVLLSQQEVASMTRRRSGPPQVTTSAYARNWEAIFGGRRKGELPN